MENWKKNNPDAKGKNISFNYEILTSKKLTPIAVCLITTS